MKRPRTKTIEGYQVQPRLPMQIGLLGAICDEADFTAYADWGACVEASVRIGLIKGPYTIVLTLPQALEADIIERA